MGYLHIDNLYKTPDILMFRECYALEKIHGTSAHVRWKDGQVAFSSGGAKHDTFVALFDADDLAARFTEIGHEKMVVNGEAYGGKCQGMKATYGDRLRFVVFDVRVGDSWLSVPDAVQVAQSLGLEFVSWNRIYANMPEIDAERDADSVQAKRNGIMEPKMREGVVLRPIFELRKNNGSRIIAKHKRAEFSETKTPREIDPEKLVILEEANAIAQEWVTEMRLSHVLDSLGSPGIERTGDVIKAMVEDVQREGEGEFVDTKDARKAIGRRTAKMFKVRLQSALYGEAEK